VTITITECGWRCLNIGCPTREPVRAKEPPTCYTCERPMAEVHYPVTEKEIGRLAAAIEVAPFGGPAVLLSQEMAEYRLPPDDLVELSPLTKWLPEPVARWRAERELAAAKDAVARGERVHQDVERYLRELPGREFPYGYDVVGKEVGRVTYSARRVGDYVALVDRVKNPECRLRIDDPVSVGYEAAVEHTYRCTRAGCPVREPVSASSPPTCYTCQQPMSEVAEFVRPALPDPGIAAEIEFFQRQLVNAAAIPAALLFGKAPAGLGARGEDEAGAIGWRAEYQQRPMPASERGSYSLKNLAGIIAHDRLGRPCARKWEYTYRELRDAAQPHPLRSVTVQFGGAALRDAHFEPADVVGARTWTVTAAIDETGLAALHDAHGCTSSLTADGHMLCERAVMTDLRIESRDLYQKARATFREILTVWTKATPAEIGTIARADGQAFVCTSAGTTDPQKIP